MLRKLTDTLVDDDSFNIRESSGGMQRLPPQCGHDENGNASVAHIRELLGEPEFGPDWPIGRRQILEDANRGCSAVLPCETIHPKTFERWACNSAPFMRWLDDLMITAPGSAYEFGRQIALAQIAQGRPGRPRLDCG